MLKRRMKKVDVSALLISAVIDGDLVSVEELVDSHGLSFLERESGCYLLLIVAIKLGHIEIAEFLLQKGAKANCETENVTTPLHLATRQRFEGLVQLLLEKNAAVDARNNKNETPLHLAAEAGYSDIVEVLLSKNASLTAQTNEGATPLFLAATARHETIVQMLLKHASINLKNSAKTKNSMLLNTVLLCNPNICEKVNKLVVSIVSEDNGGCKIVDELVDHGFIVSREFLNESLLLAAINKNYIKLINSIMKNDANQNIAKHHPELLHAAVKIGRVEMVETFLNSGFNADATDGECKTALCYSLDSEEDDECVEIIRLLLTYGADITKAPDLLHEAVTKGLIEVCKVLLDNCADVNKLDTNGRTPLFLAVSEDGSSIVDEWEFKGNNKIDETTRCKIVELLLNDGADVNINVRGFTAFHQAILSGKKRLVSIFLKRGVDADIRAEDGATPLFLAAREGDTEIVEILCENNADVNAGRGEISALCIATNKWKLKVVEMLLRFGADINFNIYDIVRENVTSNTCPIDSDYAHTRDRLIEHALKLEVAELHFKKQEFSVFDIFRFGDYKGDCWVELVQLMAVKLNPQLTLDDFLVNGKDPKYAKDKLLMWKLDRGNPNLDRFKHYKYLIRSNVRQSNFRLELLQLGQNWLNVLVKTSNKLNGKKYSVLPVELLEQIVSFLSNSELKSLISCGKALKSQLSQ